MKKLKERIPLKYLYVLSAIIAILLSVGLYYTYAMFTANVNSGNIVNMDTTLNYTFDVSGTQNFHVGKNSIASFNFIVNNSSNGSIYYEIYYSTNNDLTDVIIGEVVEDKNTTTVAPNTSGNVDKDNRKTIPLVIANNSNNDIDVVIGVVTGYVGNTITYGSNNYPNGTKITNTYNHSDIKSSCEGQIGDTSNCITKLVDGNLNTYCLTSSVANVPTLSTKILQDNTNVATRASTTFSSAFTTNNNGNTIYKGVGQDGKETYYFAGAVTNNYVYFAGFYWRIVRVNEDGSVRLIYIGSTPTSTSGYINTSIEYNTVYGKPYYVGYSYGTTQHGNGTNSNIKTTLENWYTNNISIDDDKYISRTAIYCNDRDLASGSSYSTSAGVNFAGYGRLNIGKTPTFVCNTSADRFTGTNNSSIGNQLLGDKPIALLTADEVAYAGGVFGTDNASYYLSENASSSTWWTMSPFIFRYNSYTSQYSCHDARMFAVKASGSLYAETTFREAISCAMDSYAIRPVISLKSCVTWTGGNGTSSKTNGSTGVYTVAIDEACMTKDN